MRRSDRFLSLRRAGLAFAAILPALTLLSASASAEDAKDRVPDPRWSRIYLLEGAESVPVDPATEHSSLVQLDGRAADSPDVPVKPSSNVTQSEISVAVDPNDANIVFVSANATPFPVSTVWGTGVYWSFDGGLTWTGNDQGPGGVGNNGDPATAIRGIDGRFVVGYISNSGGMGASYSTNQGATWTHRTVSSAGSLDKNHLHCDNSPSSPYYGNLYNAWTAFGGTNADDIEFSRSTDGGQTWSGAVNVSNNVFAGSHNQGVNIRTGPNGEVYVGWTIYDGWPTDETAMGMNISTDGGATWTGEFRFLENIRGHRNTSLPNTSIRRNSFPALAVDVSGGPRDGTIYITWTNIGVPGINSGDPDIYMSRSSDGGATWVTPVRINQDLGGASQWFPWISCDPVTGQLAVVFYDRRDDPSNTQARAYMATSNDGGDTWDDFAVGDVSFTPTPIPGLAGGYMGDYLGIAVQSGRAYPSWTDNRTGNFLTYVSPILVSDPTDPNPPTNVAAYSDFTTPTSVALSWTDPTTTADGTPLGDFSIDILRDDVFLVNVDQGVQSHVDVGLTDGQLYGYTLRARDDVTDSLSVDVSVEAFAGGSPFPAPPSGVSCVGDPTSATLSWTNPTTQSDGSPLDDFAGVRITRNGTFLVELARSPTDIGSPDGYVDNPPPGFLYDYAVSAIDSEVPVNESAAVSAGPCFVGDVPSILIWQPDDSISNTGTELFDALSTLGESVFLTNDLAEFSPDLTVHEIVCVCLGIYSNNHVLNSTEGAALDQFVQAGGRLYLEGGDSFNYDPEVGGYNIRPIFGVDDGPDGSGDLSAVTGINDLAGFAFSYGGGNNFIDELQPLTSSPIFQNSSNADLVAVFNPAYGAGAGRAIGASFEFGGLVDGADPISALAALDAALRVPGTSWEEPLPSGADPVKELARKAGEVTRRPVTKRVANPFATRAEAAHVPGGVGAALANARLANTKVDLAAAYLQLLRATGDPVLDVSPLSLSTTLYQNETDTQFVTLQNPGSLNAPLDFTVTEDPPVGWLTVAPVAGSVPANGMQALTVDFDATGLPPGPLSTSLIIAANDPVNPADTVSVSMTVLGIPDVSVDPTSLSFSLAPLASGEDSVTVTNTGVGDLDYTLSITGSAGSDRFELPSVAAPAAGSARYRGNVYRIDAEVPLKEIEQLLNIGAPTALEFFVFESPTSSGTFTKIFSTTTTSGTGSGWYGSGPIDVTLTAGMYYYIGAAWQGNATYYNNGGSDALPLDTEFGAVLSSGGSNAYPSPATQFISGAGAILWSQALEYGIPIDVQILSATTGSVPPSGSTVVNLQATAGPDAGTFNAALNIASNDPDTGQLVVPITIEVGATGVVTVEQAPTSVMLYAPQPNPFRSGTVLRYDLPRPGQVSLRIFDVTGRMVATLVDGREPAGRQSINWDGRDMSGNRVASGVYFSKLTTEERTVQQKLVMLR